MLIQFTNWLQIWDRDKFVVWTIYYWQRKGWACLVLVLRDILFSHSQVTYQTELFLDKNKDYVVNEHQALLNASECHFVSSLFPLLSEDSSKSSKFSSICLRFKVTLSCLLILWNCCLHWVCHTNRLLSSDLPAGSSYIVISPLPHELQPSLVLLKRIFSFEWSD